MRIIWKNRSKSNQDLSAENFTNAYFYQCNFTNSKFGILTNATFIECDLTHADFSQSIIIGIDVKRCITTGIKFPTITLRNQIAKSLIDQCGLSAFIPLHSHELVAEIMKQEGTLALKPILTTMAIYLKNHYELSWEGIVKAFIVQFGYKKTAQVAEVIFQNHPEFLQKARNTLKEVYG